jgi:hypothetical protein
VEFTLTTVALGGAEVEFTLTTVSPGGVGWNLP